MQYGRIQGLVLSLFYPAFYRDVARNWGGIGLLYLLLLLTLTWIPVLAKWQYSFNQSVNTEFPKVADKIPNISIKGGKVTSPIEQPFEAKDENGTLIFVLDTTGKINNLDQTAAMLLVTQTKMHQRDAMGNIQIHDLTQFPDFDLSGEAVRGWLDTIGTWMGVGLFPICMIGSLIRALFVLLICGLLGLIFNAAFGARLPFAALMRMAAVGMTLSIYIDTGLTLADLPVPYWFMICLALTTGYVAFGCSVSVPEPMVLEHEYGDRDYPRRDDGYDDGYGNPQRPRPDDGGFRDGERRRRED